jgi:hypothetical protein
MGDTWLEILGSVLMPARPQLARCLREREVYVAARQPVVDERARAIAACVQGINELRSAVFASNDGVVTRRMTELEREWRRLTREDVDAGLMDLWARIGPPSSIDRKPWRDSAPEARLDAVIALAADAENVDAAEAAIGALRDALAVHGTQLGARVRWRMGSSPDAHTVQEQRDATSREGLCVATLLAEPLAAARAACPAHLVARITERADETERAVHAAALARLPERPGLARALAHAARVDVVCGAAWPERGPNPAALLRALYRTGYVLTEADASGVTLEIPPITAESAS